jgi:hypothetical protein
MYLDSLEEQIKPKKILSSPIENNRTTSSETSNTKKQFIRRDVQGYFF